MLIIVIKIQISEVVSLLPNKSNGQVYLFDGTRRMIIFQNTITVKPWSICEQLTK